MSLDTTQHHHKKFSHVIVNVANVATYTAKITKKIINLIYNFKQKTSNKCIFACFANLLKDLKEILNVLNFIYKKSNFLKKRLRRSFPNMDILIFTEKIVLVYYIKSDIQNLLPHFK